MKKIGIFLVLLAIILPLNTRADVISDVDMYLTASSPTGTVSLNGGFSSLNVYLDYDLTTSDVMLDSIEAFCVENADGITEWSSYTLITLDELTSTAMRAKYQAAANIAEVYYDESEADKGAAQVAIWETVFDWDTTGSPNLGSGIFQFGSSSYFDAADVNDILALSVSGEFGDTSNWWLAISPWDDFSNGSFTEELNGQNYLVRMGTVQEPATLLLLGTGLIGLAGLGRKKFIKKQEK